MGTTRDIERHPTSEEISARAYEIYLNSWDEGFSVEHLMAAEEELIEEYNQREAQREGNRISIPMRPGEKP
jgi:hypothetical protein